MSDQEMQFADPEWQPPQSRQTQDFQARPINTPREEYHEAPQEEPADYASGYRGNTALRSEYAQPQGTFYTPRRKTQRSPWFWLILILIAISLFGGGAFEEGLSCLSGFLMLAVFLLVVAFIGFYFFGRASSLAVPGMLENRTFEVGAQPRLVVKNEAGTIRVHAGEEGRQVEVRVTQQSRGWFGASAAPRVTYDQQTVKNKLGIRAKGGWPFFGGSVSIDITAPPQSDLELKTNAGTIQVNGIHGECIISTDAGTIDALDVALRGNSRLKTNAGTITFSGSINQFGSYLFVTDAGTIDLTLPENSSFQLNARTDVGSISTDFPVAIERNFPGAKARAMVGTAPYPELKVKTDIGSISLHKGAAREA
ncbi:MAG TPA: DUF4097 family beta strand repeat-containing protein [Ktedonobacteraceae bacterium]|jgi:hypothetical protein|nr:DUF4097 family beta strand repeat-containing protein [Ktedonobacteraceae bacterium]